jgi:nucleotide-binding universal stress UspA family protein
MFEKILLPLDGSEVAEMAIPYGEELASRLGSEVVLYHVHDPEQRSQERTHQVYLDRLAETVQSNIRKGQSQSAAVKVTTIVEAGEPTENIRNLVDKNKVDLVIMTAVSTAGLKIGKMLGSVADHISRTVPVPVMLIRPQHMQQTKAKERLISNILIPLDGSDLSKLALPVGAELASKLKVSATLFQMASMVRLYGDVTGGYAYIDYTKLDEDEKKRVNDEMVKIETELKQKGLTVTHVVNSGFDAAGEIIELCKKIDTDLVVMSTHGRSGLGRWLLGSVAEKILRHGETPLLLVHAKTS